MSTIYGIYTGYHSQSISLVKDGEIINCLEEERMTRLKAGDNHDCLPEKSHAMITVLMFSQVMNLTQVLFLTVNLMK
jgi:predicted NodU family carbamoyl transferase